MNLCEFVGKMKKEVDFNLCYDEEKKSLIGLLIENNFDEIYEPLTTESLRFFLPLNGVCLIDYQLHFFRQNNIKKIYIVVTHHEKELLKYIENFQRCKKKYHDLDIEIIKMNKKIKTLGDVLRDFKTCVEIYNDVLLLLSDTIPIANIKEIIKAHFTNKEKCKNQIMTLILSHCTDENKSLNDDFVIAYDNFTFKLLLFESLKNKNYLIITNEIFDEVNTKDKKTLKRDEKLPQLKIGDNKELNLGSFNLNTSTNSIIISYDLVLPNIFIITPQVFKLFEDNFDYQCMRKDFIYNILKQEIKIEEIYVHELNNDYNYTECNQIITTLSDFRIYFKFFKTLIERNIHPFLSNANHLLPDFPKIIFSEPGLYKSKSATINDTCKLLKIVLIESYTEILENSTIENSVICKNCKIGKNVKITNSIIGKNSIIKDNVIILSSYISENTIINDNVFIDECCVIGRNMHIPSDVKIDKYTRLSIYKYLKDKLKLEKKNIEDDTLNGWSKKRSIELNSTEHTIQQEHISVKVEREDNTFIEIPNETYNKAVISDLCVERGEEIDANKVKGEKDPKKDKEQVNAEKEEEYVNTQKEEENMYIENKKKDVSAEKEEKDSTFENNECNIFNSEPFEISNYVVKTKYTDDQLRLFSLIGNVENYIKLKIPSSSEYDSEQDTEEESIYSTSKIYTSLSDTNVSDKEDESNSMNSLNLNDVNNHFNKINIENEKLTFSNEISLLCKEAIEKPQFMSHKILEMKSFRLSLNYTDLDIIISFFPIVWDFMNKLEFDKNTWVDNFDNVKLDLLFSSFLLDDQLYYETVYGLILNYSKKQYLKDNVKNSIYGPDKLCGAFEYIYHSDIFEFNYFNEWINKNESDDYLTNNKRLKAFAEWLSEE
ncbi:W2 domain-containing protein [Plasmodium brasilianum]|nr:W2 domain-containing protein [Plasmodium brasilianum]